MLLKLYQILYTDSNKTFRYICHARTGGGNATFDNNEQSSKIADHSIERKHIYNIQTETTL